MNGVRTSQRIRSYFTKPEMADLSLPHQPGHAADHFLDGYGGVSTMGVVKIERLHCQPRQGCLACTADILRRVVNDRSSGAWLAHQTEFRRDTHSCGTPAQKSSEQ